MLIPDAFLLGAVLIIAACSVLLKPPANMPRRLYALSVAMVGAVYLADACKLLTMAGKASTLRFSLFGLALVIIINFSSWRWGKRVWNL